MTADIARRLDELAAAHAKATPGPWSERQDFIDQGVPDNSKTLNGPDGGYLGTVALSYRGEDNAAAIVAEHNAIPWLLAHIREQDARIAAGLALADEWERGATRWEHPLPVPPEVARLRAALTAPLTTEESDRCLTPTSASASRGPCARHPASAM